MITGAVDPTTLIEGVPPWLIYLVGAVLTPIVGVFVLWLRRLLRVDTDTTSTSPVPGPRAAEQAPAPPPPPAPDPQWELLEGMVGRLQRDHDQLTVAHRELATKAAQQETQIAAQQATIDELRATIRALIEGRGATPPHGQPRQQ